MKGNLNHFQSVCLHEMGDYPDVTCCACADSKTLFTGFVTGAVSVWSVCNRPRKLRFRRTLSGHSSAITAICACAAHTILVTASRDATAIVWHLSALTFIRQLCPHPGPVTALAVNDATVFLFSCLADKPEFFTENFLFLYERFPF